MRSTFWYIFKFRNFKRLLKKYDLIDVKPFKYLSWHLGCNYFIAYTKYDRKKVFIKTGGKYNLTSREVAALNYLDFNKDEKAEWKIPKVIASLVEGEYSFIAIEFIEAQTLTSIIKKNELSVNEKRKILCQFNEIIDCLHSLEIVHRDIRPDNILIKKNGSVVHVVLIDFAFIVSKKNSEYPELPVVIRNSNLLKGLGAGLNPGPFIWDDAYSFYKVFIIMDQKTGKYKEEIEILKSKQGKLTYNHFK